MKLVLVIKTDDPQDDSFVECQLSVADLRAPEKQSIERFVRPAWLALRQHALMKLLGEGG